MLRVITICLAVAAAGPAINRVNGQEADPGAAKLKSEVATKGWLLFAALTDKGDYDLFACRPDGSAKRNLTQTPGINEFGAHVAPGGKQMLYRSMPTNPDAKTGKVINHDLWGAAGTLVFANLDGSNPKPQGADKEWPWACWSPDGKQIACLYKREGKIRVVDAESKKLVRELPRHGIFQQFFWSADGQRFCGTANLEGQDWNILSVETATEKAVRVSRNLCCTPDWFRGSPEKLIYSCRVPGVATQYGWTMLMQATADGKSRSLIYGERGRHIYYGCTSPDDAYVVFSRPVNDGGTDAEMALIRLADAPIIVPGDYKPLQELYPHSKEGPVLRLGQAGFEPDWTYAELGGK